MLKSKVLSPRWVLATALALDLGMIVVAELMWGPEAFMGGLGILLAIGLALVVVVRRRWPLYVAAVPLLLAAFVTFQLTVRGAKDVGDGIPALALHFAGWPAKATLSVTGAGLLLSAALGLMGRQKAHAGAVSQRQG